MLFANITDFEASMANDNCRNGGETTTPQESGNSRDSSQSLCISPNRIGNEPLPARPLHYRLDRRFSTFTNRII